MLRNGPVHQIEVEVVQAESLERFVDGFFDVFEVAVAGWLYVSDVSWTPV